MQKFSDCVMHLLSVDGSCNPRHNVLHMICHVADNICCLLVHCDHQSEDNNTIVHAMDA